MENKSLSRKRTCVAVAVGMAERPMPLNRERPPAAVMPDGRTAAVSAVNVGPGSTCERQYRQYKQYSQAFRDRQNSQGTAALHDMHPSSTAVVQMLEKLAFGRITCCTLWFRACPTSLCWAATSQLCSPAS